MKLVDYFFVEKHNERVRNFWHNRLTTISCRVESTIKGRAGRFGINIVAFLYNECLNEFNQKSHSLYMRDYNIIQKKFGFDRASLSTQEQYLKAMEVRNLSKSEVWTVLELNYVGSARVQGLHKELFYLKCLVNNLNPQFTLRCLYFMTSVPRPEDRERFNVYQDEIIYLLDKILIDRNGE